VHQWPVHTLTSKFIREIIDQLWFLNAEVFTEILSAPFCKRILTSSTLLIPPHCKRNIDIMGDPVHQFTQRFSFSMVA
jgi:hypothetical protein